MNLRSKSGSRILLRRLGGLRSLVGILHRLYDPLVEGRRVGVENRRGVSDGTAYQLFIDHGFLRHGMQSVLCE